MRQVETSSARAVPAGSRARGRLRLCIAGLFATCLMAAGLLGTFSTVASASTSAFSLSLTSGTFGVHGNTPTALPTSGASLAGHVSSTTGHISAGTLTIPAWHESNTGSSETIHIFDVHSGTATGSIDYHGDVTVDDTVTIQVHITSPINETCTSTPVDLTLQSTSPYSTTTKDVDLSDTTFSIPDFSSSTCALARTTLDSKFAGSSGNVLTLDLHGTLPEPPPPAVTSKTTLSTSPASPQLQGTSVTLKATVKKTTGAPATTATGTMDFYDHAGSTPTTIIAAVAVSSGSASYTTSALPAKTDVLKAVYSGNSTYAGSTSSTVSYVIQPKPIISLSLPSSVITGASPATFSATITNPATGKSWSSLWLALQLSFIATQTSSNVTLSYKDSGGTWCPITLTGTTNIVGTFKGLAGSCGSPTAFSLTAGHSLTIPLEISYTSAARLGTQTFTATLETVSGTTVVTPLAGGTAPTASGKFGVDPPVKYTVSVGMTLPGTATPQGYVVLPNATVTKPSTPRHLPVPTGTVSYIVGGVTLATSGATPLALEVAKVPTGSLTVGSHTLEVKYTGNGVYNGAHATGTFTVGTPAPGTAFTCSTTTFPSITASVVASGTLPATSYTGKATATSVDVTLHIDPHLGPNTTTGLTSTSILLSPGGGTTASSETPTETSGITSVSWTGLTVATIPITGSATTEVSVGVETVNFTQGTIAYTCGAKTSAAHIGTVKVVNPPTPVTWTLGACTSGHTTAPAWANTEKIVAKGAGGGGGGAAASATGYGGAGGAGGSVTTYLTIAGSSKVSAKTGCAGKGAPQGSGVVGSGGAAVSGWSSSGKGGQGRYTALGFASGNDGTGGSGGGSTGVCNGSTTCTSSTLADVVAVASGGGGGGESMCSGTDAGSGGQAGNAGTTATSSSKGKGLSGTGGATGGTGGVAGGAGGANNKSTGSGTATGSAGGEGKEPFAGDGGGSGGGGAGFIGGAGGAKTADDCGAGGGGGGGASWVATAGGSTTFGTGASGGSRSGTTGTAGSVTVTFSYTKTR